MFHWAKKNEVLEAIPNIDAVSKVRVIRKESEGRSESVAPGGPKL
jgi:hypothetical protein